MTLGPEHLTYPHRRRGMDHDWYDWSILPRRPRFDWPGGRLAVVAVVPIEFFPLNPSGKPFKAPGAMQTPYPDLRHFTTRDYGNRVGAYRLMDLFDRLKIKAAFAVQSAVAERTPALVAEIAMRGHEIIAHGVDTDHIHYTGLAEAEERERIARCLDTLERVGGRRPQGWLSPAFSESFATLGLLAEAGLDYCCDWVNDELPFPMRTQKGGLTAFPLANDLDDRQILITMKHSEADWTQQLTDAADCLHAESARYGARMLRILLTPYIAGLPYRIAAAEAILAHALSLSAAFAATPGELVRAYRAAGA